MCEEGWLFQLRQEGCARVRGTVWNTWKGGGTEERGGDTEILKNGGCKLGQGVGVLKGVGGGLDWNPLTNYGVRSVLISILASFGFIIWCLDILLHFLTSWRFARLPPVSTDHFFSSWFQVKVSFYFVVWCISINTNGQSKENTLWNWLSTVALGGWSSPLFIWKWESTPNQH